jgi:hypothetical protein
MKVVSASLLAIIMMAGSWAFALSELELRQQWSDSIVETAKGVCKGESKKALKKLNYAAILVIHNEVEEARQVLEMASGKVMDKKCQAAIVENIKRD